MEEEKKKKGKEDRGAKHSVFLSYKEFKWNARGGPGGLRILLLLLLLLFFFFHKKK